MFLILMTKINFFYDYKNYCTHHFQPFDTCVVPHLTQSENLIQVENITKEKAKQISVLAIKNYLRSASANSNKKLISQVKQNFYKKIKSYLIKYYIKYFYKDIFTKLISKKSKYRNDALEIYNLITNNTYVKQ